MTDGRDKVHISNSNRIAKQITRALSAVVTPFSKRSRNKFATVSQVHSAQARRQRHRLRKYMKFK